jgi:hypothetical protein
MTPVNSTGKQSQRTSLRARLVTALLGLAALGFFAAPAASAESAQAVSVSVTGVATIEIGPGHPSDWPWPHCQQQH